MPITDKPEVRDLLKAARATRDYCIVTGRGKDGVDGLIVALEPFDGDHTKLRAAHLTTLRQRMREVCREIDPYTLTRILEGQSPVVISPIYAQAQSEDDALFSGGFGDYLGRFWAFRKRWPKLWQRAILPGLAVVFLLLAMHFTHWTLKANALLAQVDDHLSLDFNDEIRDLIIVAKSLKVDKELGQGAGATNPAQKLFDQTMTNLRSYDRTDRALSEAFLEAKVNYNPFVSLGNSISRTVIRATSTRMDTPPTEEEVKRALAEKADEAVIADNEAATEPETAEVTPAINPADSLLDKALNGHDEFKSVVTLIAKEIGSLEPGVTDYEASSLQLAGSATDLSDKVSLVNRWWLPVLYGSLGAVLFCLVRVLTPSLSDLGPGRGFLRILFGAFSAMTLSMLFIPANVFAVNAQSNPTLIFLFCFLFGYSFDAVLAALHRLETYLQGQMRTDDASPKT